MIERSIEFVAVGYFLARYSETGAPPSELGVKGWSNAYASFFRGLHAGRSLGSFVNSLKATRDTFDGWVESPRAGWRSPEDPTKPKPLQQIEQDVLARWAERSRKSLWGYVGHYADLGVAEVPPRLLADLINEPDPEGAKKTEGGRRVVLSSVVERDPSLRAAALKIHGTACMACGFSFEQVYGDWGRGYVEVHHLQLLADKVDPGLTDPKTDLVVLCANCHRMVHRRRDAVLTLEELKAKIRVS